MYESGVWNPVSKKQQLQKVQMKPSSEYYHDKRGISFYYYYYYYYYDRKQLSFVPNQLSFL